MYGKLKDHLETELKSIDEAGIYKRERVITTPQGANVHVSTGEEVVICLLYTSPSPRDATLSRMPSSA